MNLGRFNDQGVAIFQAFLDSCTTTQPLPYPESALTDSTQSESIDNGVTLEQRSFATRFELAEYLHSRFNAADFRPAQADKALWSWIACFYFQQICPKKGDAWSPGAAARWIPQSSDWRRYYRHLVAGPYGIYRAHQDNPKRALAVLCQRPGRPGDLVEQLASRQEIVTNPGILQAATYYFVDEIAGIQRKTANSKGRGGARRFIDVLKQFDVTWDLSALSGGDLLQMLPKEFTVTGLL